MAWSTTAPTLPSGSAWEQEQPTSVGYNYWTLATTRSIARLEGNQIAVRITCVVSNGSYGSFISPGNYTFRCDIGGVTGTEDTSFKIAKGTASYYFVGEAADGAEVVTICGYSGSSSSKKSITFTAPKLLGGQLYVNVNGSWKQATAYINVGGSWKEVTPKINVGGTWK
jgi:hypothetical protein